MPADEVTHGTDVDESRVRTGPRHAAPKKPLFTRFHMPAGKAIASVAMPTAVLMGMGFTSTLALADNGTTPPSSKSLTADEYKDCVTALDGAKDASASPSPSASASESTPEATPTPTATATAQDSTSGKTSSSDSGSGDKATPTPTATSGSSDSGAGSGSGSDTAGSGGGAAATPAPSASQSSGGNLLDTIGDTIGDILTGGSKDSGSTPSASPTPSATSTSDSSAPASSDGKGSATDTVKDTVDRTTKTVTDTVKDTTDAATKAATDTTKAVQDATQAPAPTPSASSSTSADNCPVATDDESGVDNKVPVADDPWYLNASSLLLKGADYQGIVEVKTANGTKKKVLKYVISGGTDIGDLHQTVNDKQSGKTYHVQAAKGSTSTIRDGDTVMYTQSISGNLFGLIPVTFSPDSPPPLNIPLIYFTNVKVTQAAQFGGSLHVPGMHVYTTD